MIIRHAPIADNRLRLYSPNKIYPTEPFIEIKSELSTETFSSAVFKFDIPDIAVKSAAIRLNLRSVSIGGTIQVTEIGTSWNENDASWASVDKKAINLFRFTRTISKANADEWVAIDVTELVRDRPGGQIAVYVEPLDDPMDIEIVSKDSSSENLRPELVVTGDEPSDVAVANFTSEPSDANITWPGKPVISKTPFSISDEFPLDFDATIYKDGYQSETFNVSVAVGESKDYHTALTESSGTEQPGIIKGIVAHALLNTPLNLVTVSWGSYSAVTGSDGAYRIEVTEGFTQPLTVDFPGFEPFSKTITAGPGQIVQEQIQLMPIVSNPTEGADIFQQIMQAGADIALAAFPALSQTALKYMFQGILALADGEQILEQFAEQLGNKFAAQYSEWSDWQNWPPASMTVMAVVGLIAGLLGFGTYIQHLRKEIPEGPGLAVWRLIEQGLWQEANEANKTFLKTINVANDSWLSYFAWLNPITGIWAQKSYQSQLAQHDAFQKTIDANMTGSASADVKSTPTGAKIYLDGNYTFEQTNTTLTVVPGSHTITLKKDGYADKTLSFDVPDGGTAYINAALVLAVDVSLTISSTPSGAKIYLDNSYLFEATPAVINAPSGSHTITLKLTGYKDHNINYDYPTGTTKSLNITLQQDDGGGTVVDQPAEEVVIPLEPAEGTSWNSWKITIKGINSVTGEELAAWILIDDVFKGVTTPAVFYLAPESTYNIKLRLEGYRQGEVDYTTKPLPTQ